MNDNYLIHFGNKNSGRYPRGSGERPHQHDGLRSRIGKKKARLNNRIERRETARDAYKLSDEELNQHINRLDRENRLKDATKRVNSGRGELNKTLKVVGGVAATGVVGAISKSAGKSIAKKVGLKTTKDVLKKTAGKFVVKKTGKKAATITIKKAAKKAGLAATKNVGKQITFY